MQDAARLLLQGQAQVWWLQDDAVVDDELCSSIQPDDAQRLLAADAAVGQDEVLKRDCLPRLQLHPVCHVTAVEHEAWAPGI